MKLALFNFEPKYCSNCGRTSVHRDSHYGNIQYQLRNSFQCPCGFRYQKAKEETLLHAAALSDGDLLEAFHSKDAKDAKDAFYGAKSRNDS